MKTKKEIDEIRYGITQIQKILAKVRPNKKWTIKYVAMTANKLKEFSDWDIERMHFYEGCEYIVIWDEDGHLLYSSNETGNSTMWTLRNLMDILGNKF